jgi:hypothetical protein
VLDELDPHAEGVRHLVLDLRGLTFIDLGGMRELLRQDEYARSNRHNWQWCAAPTRFRGAADHRGEGHSFSSMTPTTWRRRSSLTDHHPGAHHPVRRASLLSPRRGVADLVK